MATSAFIGIGSNLGDRVKNCLDAIESIRDIPGCAVESRSDLFTTEPQGVRDQDWFVNGGWFPFIPVWGRLNFFPVSWLSKVSWEG